MSAAKRGLDLWLENMSLEAKYPHTGSDLCKGTVSERCFVETGVPQGSELQTLLFPLYNRSLGSAITSHGFSYHRYADNTINMTKVISNIYK